MSGLDHDIAAVQPLLDRWGYGAVFLAVFVEGVGVPAPGQTLLLAGAALAARGDLSFAALLATAALAAALGNLGGWAIGRWGGHRLLERFAGGPRLERIDDLFRRWGGLVVLLGRFVDGARQLNGITAGALDMALVPFLAWNLAGALLWTGFWGLGAYWLERDFVPIAHFFHRMAPFAIGAVVVLVALGLAWLARGRRSRSPA